MYSNIQSSSRQGQLIWVLPLISTHASDLPIYGLREWVTQQTTTPAACRDSCPARFYPQTESKVPFVLSCRACPNDLPTSKKKKPRLWFVLRFAPFKRYMENRTCFFSPLAPNCNLKQVFIHPPTPSTVFIAYLQSTHNTTDFRVSLFIFIHLFFLSNNNLLFKKIALPGFWQTKAAGYSSMIWRWSTSKKNRVGPPTSGDIHLLDSPWFASAKNVLNEFDCDCGVMLLLDFNLPISYFPRHRWSNSR